MSWKAVTASHDAVQQAFVSYRGQTLRAYQIKDIVRSIPGLKSVDFIQASDHCDNVSNVASCKDCGKQKPAIFHRVKFGHYVVL